MMTTTSNDPKQLAADCKPQLQLMPPIAMLLGAEALQHGARKYGTYNWRFSDFIKIMTYIGAMLRHIFAYLGGENIDQESGVHHLGHVIATCAILLDAEACGKLKDDRPGAGHVQETS